MNSIRHYYLYLLRKHLFSWRMLAIAILTVLTMDSLLSGIRVYCRALNVKMSQWGFALIWNNKYVGLCFLLIFIFAVAIFPEDREKECYIIARIGTSFWTVGQELYLLTFGWIYTIFLFVVQNLLLCNVMEAGNEWGKGWATLSNSNIILQFNIYPTVSLRTVSNYQPVQANLLVVFIMGMLFGMLGMMIFWLNFYSRLAGPLVSSALVFMGMAASKNMRLSKFSPTSWIDLDSHYRITNTYQPTEIYIFGMLILWTGMFLLLAKMRVNRTQENNRRSR